MGRKHVAMKQKYNKRLTRKSAARRLRSRKIGANIHAIKYRFGTNYPSVATGIAAPNFRISLLTRSETWAPLLVQ